MPTRGRHADDMIASLMQEMGEQQGYQNNNYSGGMSRDDDVDGLERRRTAPHQQLQELSNYPDNTYKAGSQSIWNPLVKGESGSSLTTTSNASSTTSSFLIPTNPRIEVTRRRIFEKFRQEVQTLLQDFQTKNLTFSSSLSSGDSSSFSKSKNKMPIPSMIEKWHMDAKLEERNFLLKKMSTTKDASRNHSESGDAAYRPVSFSSTTDILRERAWRKQNSKPIYDPILLNKHAPQIFTETILKPQVQKMWQQVERPSNQNSPMPPKFNKKAQQVQKGLFRLICEAIDSFESQLLQCSREESTRSTSAKRNRKGKDSGNKRPKIAFGQEDGGNLSSTSLVRVTFSGVTLKLHRAYLEKLQRLYDRTEDRRQQTGDSTSLSASYRHLSFEEALFCLLCRYDMIQGAGLQAGVPGAIMDVLLERFDCRMECFASPFNCRYDCFASAFEDVDAPFGSKGSFFELPGLSDELQGGSRADSDGNDDDDSRSTTSVEKGICFEANPPFCDGLILQLNQKITNLLSAKKRETPIMFVVFVPAWRDSECYQALLTNQRLTQHLLLKQGEHWYAEGTQHRRKDSFRVASFDTSILFYQNDSAKKLWNLQKDDNPAFLELRSAFGQDPGNMQKEEKAMERISKRVGEKSPSSNQQSDLSGGPPGTSQTLIAKVWKKQPIPMAKAAKPKKANKGKKRQLNNPKDEGKAQLALLESLGLSSTATKLHGATSSADALISFSDDARGKASRKNKKRGKKKY
mmetsp:Transcript_16458/g.41293  ORF Transcript_16458/g.41293 Transcript_16458/m.41293 type:complete len:746 (-) Transcript_16458:101-2338(-)